MQNPTESEGRGISETFQMGEDVVAELQTAMEKQGVDMHVAALVSA